MITITAQAVDYKEIKETDKEFYSYAKGGTRVPRAGFELSKHCPEMSVMHIFNAIDKGWLKVVAYEEIKENE